MMLTSPYLEKKMENENCYCNMQVVFVDIVSYSKRLPHVQVKVIHAFMNSINEALLNTARQYVDQLSKIEAHIPQSTVILPSGDGAAIAFPFENILKMHLFFAEELLRIIAKTNMKQNCSTFQKQGWCDCHDGFLLRCGVSEGMLILYKDLNKNFNVAGNAVNMAARVMDLAGDSQVFLTQDAYEKVINFGSCTKTQFKKYEQVRIKHDLRIDVYQYVDDSIEGLDVSIRSDHELADDGVEPDDELEPVKSPPKSGAKALDAKRRDAGSNSDALVVQKDLVKVIRERLVHVPATEFKMGNDHTGRFLVKISRPFQIDSHPISQAVYMEVMESNHSRFVGDDLPVENISWLDAITFCNRLSELSGLDPSYEITGDDATLDFGRNGYRLPTEAEWEYCCRGGGQKELYGPIDKVAWYNGNAKGQTHAVGTKDANGFDLYDMLGNVWEWCNDRYQQHYPKERQVDYVGPESGVNHVLRGGSWADTPLSIKSSFRRWQNALSRESTHGLRVALRWSE